MKFNSKGFEFAKFDREKIEKEIELRKEAEKEYD